jgi:hypothetical protein
MMPPSPFHRLRSHIVWWESWIFGFLHALGFSVALVMVFYIVGYRFCAEDYHDGVVILVCVFLCCGMPPLLLLTICCLPSSILVVLPGAYVPLGLLDLAVLCAGMLELLPVLLQVSLV